jgi:hypothetical protein
MSQYRLHVRLRMAVMVPVKRGNDEHAVVRGHRHLVGKSIAMIPDRIMTLARMLRIQTRKRKIRQILEEHPKATDPCNRLLAKDLQPQS